MNRRLVILTTHFGNNFSGGSRATCEVVNRLQHTFSEILVLGTELGQHDIRNLKFIETSTWLKAYQKVTHQ